MNLDELELQIVAQQRKIDNEIVEARLLATEGVKVQKEVASLQQASLNLEKAAVLLSNMSEERQKDAQHKIEMLVTQGLQKIFGSDLSFHVVSSLKGKTPVVDFFVRTTLPDGKIIDTSVLSARGGGLAAVVGFLLRLVLLLLSKDEKARFLVLDETFAHVSSSYLPSLVEFLREVADKSNTQIIMVTHEPAFLEVADVGYKFKLDSQSMTSVEAL